MKRIHFIAFVALVTVLVAGCSRESTPSKTLMIGFSNDMVGEIRSCGCAAKDYGGLGRRATFLKQVRDTTRADFLLVEGGDFFSEKLNYSSEKADLTLKSMALMDYHGAVIGEKDMSFGLDYIEKRARELRVPVVLANLMRADTLVFPPTRVVTLRSGLRVGLVGIISRQIELPPQVDRKEVTVTQPEPALEKYLPELRANADVVVVLGHMGRGEAMRLAKRFSAIDLIVYGHEGRPMRRTKRFGNAFLLQIADRGRDMGLAYAVLDEDDRIRSLGTSIAPLTSFYRDDDAIDKLFKVYDLNIAAKEKTNIPAGVFAARKGLEKPFAGDSTCQPCHADIHAQWSSTPHAHAFERLSSQNRGYDRDCTPCHTTGFYERGGFENITVTPKLVNVQCESCHGNAHDHIADPKKKTPGTAQGACHGCHTVDQTPDFDFDTFWQRIHH